MIIKLVQSITVVLFLGSMVKANAPADNSPPAGPSSSNYTTPLTPSSSPQMGIAATPSPSMSSASSTISGSSSTASFTSSNYTLQFSPSSSSSTMTPSPSAVPATESPSPSPAIAAEPSPSPLAAGAATAQGPLISLAVPSWSRIDSTRRMNQQDEYAGYGYSIGNFPARWWVFPMNIENHWSESFQYTVYKTGVQWMAFKDSHTPTDGVEVSVIYNCAIMLLKPLSKDVMLVLNTTEPVLPFTPVSISNLSLYGTCYDPNKNQVVFEIF